MKNFFTVKSHSLLALIVILAISLFYNSTAYSQTLASPYVVTTFPTTISNINTAGGETAAGMQGACFTIPCCSVEVFKVTLPANGVLRVEMTNFTPLGASIIAYRPLVANPTGYSDLQYISGSPGNFCGFRDTLQLGRAFTDNWDNIPYGGTPTQYSGLTSVYDFNNPAPLAGYYPAGDYYLIVFNENQQASQGIGASTDLTFEFAEACAPLTAPTALNFDTLEYNSESDTVSFFVKNERTLDIDIDTSNIGITGTNASEFIFLPVSDTSLAVGDSLQFQVVFTPTSGGARTASIEIPFSDTSCSTSSSISLNGYGAQPEIVVLGNNNSITNNDLTPSTSNFTNMGSVVTNTGSITKNFQITNTGSDTLTFTNNPIISLSGNSQFTISSQPASSVLPGDTTSFEITFTPTVDGSVSSDISIANNDLDESTFTFRIEATGAERNGLHFDGSNDYVNINTVSDDMAGISAWTIESWIKADPSQTGNDHIMAVNTTGTGTIFLFRLDDGFLDFYDGSTAFEVGPDLRDDTWHHIAATYDNGQLSLFIDGIPQGAFNAGTISFASNNRWSLGQEYDGSSRSEYFKGALNEVRIWKTVKTTQEIADGRYCEIQSPASNTNLTGYYTFNQGISGGTNTGINTITDASGYANDGTPTNFALTGTTSNFVAATNVGVNCNSVRIALCDVNSYSVPGGNTYTSSGVYIDTLTNSNGGDSIVYTDLSIRYFQITQDHINDTTVCDTIKEFAQTSYTPFARFENTDNDWVEINGAVDSLVNTNRSVFLWMREADQISGSADILVGMNTSGTSTVCNLGIATNEQLWIYDGGNNRYSGVVVTDGQWHFVGYTYDEASNQTQFWVDGVAANSFTNGQSISATSRISLGQEFDGSSPSDFYDGDMAEVTIWNEVLDATDIALLMQSSVQSSHPKYNKLKAYYPMISECNNSDLTLKDFGPHAYHGTMTANDIIITDTLAHLPNHNAAPLYSKSWIRNGTQISTSDSLFLTTAIQGGTYGLNLSLDYFNISDSWTTTVNPACQGLFASVVVDSHVNCNGLSNGAATASATGGTTPYTYSWNTGATTASITGISAGTYSVTVTDNMGSTDSTSITITEPTVLISSAMLTGTLSCNGDSDGQVTASATGGTGTYTYTWNTGTSTSSVASLGAGTYSVTVSDANGCTDSSSISLTQPSALSISATSGTDSIDVSVTGGTTPYNYIWSNGATVEDLNNIPSGIYTVTITDGNGCTDTYIENVVNPAEYFITTWKTDNSGTSNNTSITIPTSNGYTYNYDVDWNGDGIFDEFGLTGDATHDYGTSGTYTVQIKGNFPYLGFYATQPTPQKDNAKILSVEQWGIQQWSSMKGAFKACENIVFNATDTPDLSAVTDMSRMFENCSNFNSDISSWDVTTTTNMDGMFANASAFNQNIGSWNVSNVTNMKQMFSGATVFNQNIGTWNVSNVTNMSYMFRDAVTFNQNIGSWNTSSTTTMQQMFSGATVFNQDISTWDVDSVTNMNGIFKEASAFNQPIGIWDVGNVTIFSQAFYNATVFNGDISTWDVSSATTLASMFALASNFNQDISSWDVDSVTNMSFLFHKATSFDQDLSSWDVGAVTKFQGTFQEISWSPNISTWDVSSATNMKQMFALNDSVNIDLSNWDVSAVTNMIQMFKTATSFDQNLSNWNISAVTHMDYMFYQTGLSIENYDSTLIGWASQSLQNGVSFHAGNSKYCAGETARQTLTGTYNWSITDGGKSCPPSVSISATHISCNSISDGTASASASGGTAPYSYLWSTGATNATINGLAAGIYSVTITDNSGITDSTSVTITQPTILVSSAVVDSNTTCNGFSNGGATATASGGIAPYTYSWSNGATNVLSITGVTANTYSVTITDANGCTDSTSVAITEPALLVATAVVDSNITCNGLSNGGATASANGGNAPYTYNWSNAGATASITGVIAGSYTITITDANGCTTTSSTTITEPAVLTAVSVVDSNATCNGFSNGGATASANGGTAPYSYSWSNGATMGSITGVTAGTYSITVSDANGCTATSSATITEPAVLTAVSVVDSNVTCNGFSNGGATASANGGTTPYTYVWSNGVTMASITGVTAGTYTITVSDANGCSAISSTTITEPTALMALSVVDSNTTCNGFSDGGATASANGGTAPYTYVWSNGATTSSITGLVASSYSITITDANGCTATSSTTITEPAVLTAVSVVDSNVTCNGFSNGGATASANGGTMPYTYNWSNTGATASITGVIAGSYTATITDANGCTTTSSVTITEPTVLTAISVVDSNVTCNGFSNGGATASANGGTMPYTYNWSNAGATASITGVTAGSYTATITDANGCTATSSVTITEPTVLTAISVVDSNATCYGSANGGASVSANGGTTPYTYLWSNGNSTTSITGIIAGTYTVTATDANGCTTTSSVTITQPTDMTLTIVVDSNTTCYGLSNGGATVSAVGGTGAYTYAWNNNTFNTSISGVTAGNYSVTVTDANSCTKVQTVTITEPNVLFANITLDSNATCDGLTNGGVSTNPSGGTAPYNYNWSVGQTTTAITGLSAGSYTVTVTDANSCSSIESIIVSSNNSSYNFVNIDACDSYVSPSGNYTWTTTGIYQDTIPNSIGCDSILTISLSILSDSIYQTLSICNGDSVTIGSNTYSTSGVYTDMFTNTVGCDSIVVTDLTVTTVDVSVTQNGFQLEANNTFGSYQWINCDSNNAIILNATNRTYMVTVSGNYAVIVTEGSCSDTSSCILMDGLGIKDFANEAEINVYPNPTGTDQDIVNIEVHQLNKYDLIIRDLSGKVVYIQQEIYWNSNQIDISGFAAGTFFIEIKTDQFSEYRKLIVM